MPGLFVSDGTANVEILDPSKVKAQVYTYDSNGKVLSRQWVDVYAIRTMENGAWVDVWPKPFANINNFVVYGGGILAGYRINADGNAEWKNPPAATPTYGVIETWLKKGSANQFVVMASKDANPAYAVPFGSPLDQWIDCSTSPEWWVEWGDISLLTVTIGRVDGSGGGAAMTDDAGLAFQDSAGNAITDTTITVTAMDSAQITLNATIE